MTATLVTSRSHLLAAPCILALSTGLTRRVWGGCCGSPGDIVALSFSAEKRVEVEEMGYKLQNCTNRRAR